MAGPSAARVTGSPSVTGWADQSGNSNNLVVQGGATSPTFHATGLGGKESIGFVAGDSLLTAPTNTMTNMGTGNLASVFVLASLTTSASGNGISYTAAGQAATTGANSAIFFFLSTTPDFTWAHSFANGTPLSVTASTETRMGMIFDGSVGTSYKNNVAGSTNALNFNWSSPGTFHVGDGGPGWAGEIREIIVTNTALSSGDRASLDAYLVSRQ